MTTRFPKPDPREWLQDLENRTDVLEAAAAAEGTVTSVSVTTANGVSGSVATATTTPAITLTLGAITPTSVAATGNVTGANLSGTNTGDQTIALTGDVTGSGTGTFAATIAADAVTYAKMQNVSATDKLLGRSTAGAGNVEEIDCTAAGRALIDDASASDQRTTLGLANLTTRVVQLPPGAAELFATASTQPEWKKTDGTNFPVSGYAFDAATSEQILFAFRADKYGSGNLTLALDWYADSASSGDVIWGAQLAVITPNTDTQDVETDAFATANTVTDTHLGTTGQRLHRAEITISNLDSLAADDLVFLRVYRDAAAVGDTMTGDAILAHASLSYSTV